MWNGGTIILGNPHIDKKHHNTPSGSVPGLGQRDLLIFQLAKLPLEVVVEVHKGDSKSPWCVARLLSIREAPRVTLVREPRGAPFLKKKNSEIMEVSLDLYMYINSYCIMIHVSKEMKWQVTLAWFLETLNQGLPNSKIMKEGIIHFKWYYVAFWPASSGHFQYHNSQNHTSSIYLPIMWVIPFQQTCSFSTRRFFSHILHLYYKHVFQGSSTARAFVFQTTLFWSLPG